DDIAEIQNIDLLHIDVEGYELEILRHGLLKLAMAVAVQSEVHFLPMHRGQPLFSDVDHFMREQGFLIHKFAPMNSRVLRPLALNNDIRAGLSQIVWTDALYVRDFRRFDELSPMKLVRLAVILHEVYASYDLAYHALLACDRKQQSKLAERYSYEVLQL